MLAFGILSYDFPYIVEYTTPDGGTVQVTEVRNVEKHGPSNWEDAVNVGEVCKFVRRIK